MYVFSHHNELWRDLVLQEYDMKNGIEFNISWKDTYISGRTSSFVHHKPLSIKHVYSDTLYKPWSNRTFNLELNCKGFTKFEDLPRESAESLTMEHFVRTYESQNRPVIITDLVTTWKAYKWTMESLKDKCGNRLFRATASTASAAGYFTMAQYEQYCQHTIDEVPLYLFERNFAQFGNLQNDYTPPSYFQPSTGHYSDLFRLLEKHRPDFRWLIAGPQRSGSIFHVDPNQTNAWNAAIRGRKKWIFYPPQYPPPGVKSSPDGAEVLVPLSTGEWLMAFWNEHLKRRQASDVATRPMECVVQPGEVVFVPHNWWHMVVNLDDCVAITQNYVSESNLADCLRFLRDKSDQISGLHTYMQDPLLPDRAYDVFVSLLKEHMPDKIRDVLAKLEINSTSLRNIIGSKRSLLDVGTDSEDHPSKKCEDNAFSFDFF